MEESTESTGESWEGSMAANSPHVLIRKHCCRQNSVVLFRVMCGRLFCGVCGHEMCLLCELDLDWNLLLLENRLDDEDYFWRGEEDQMEYNGRIPMDQLLEGGPTLEDLEKLPGNSRFTSLSGELKTMILAYMFTPGPRVIRAFYCPQKNIWSYRSAFTGQNKVPFVLRGFAGSTRRHAAHLFEPAPQLDFQPYPYFNYNIDTLFLDIQYCGSDYYDMIIYKNALKSGIELLVQNQIDNPDGPVLKNLKVGYCTIISNPPELIQSIEKITGIEKLVLKVHRHYCSPSKPTPYRTRRRDCHKLKKQWDNNAFKSDIFSVQIYIGHHQILPRVPKNLRITEDEDFNLHEDSNLYEDPDSDDDFYSGEDFDSDDKYSYGSSDEDSEPGLNAAGREDNDSIHRAGHDSDDDDDDNGTGDDVKEDTADEKGDDSKKDEDDE